MSTSSSTPVASQTRGYVIVLIGTTLWSTTAILIRYLTERQMPALVLAFWRDLFVALALLIALAVIRPRLLRIGRQHLRFFLLYGLVLMVFNATWTISVALNGAAVSTVLAYSSPAMTALLGWWLWKESLSAYKISAVLMSLVGCVLVSGAYSGSLWRVAPAGIIVGLLSGLMFAVYSIFGKETSHRGINPWAALMLTFAFAAAFFLILLQLPLNLVGPELNDIGRARDLLWLSDDLLGWLVLIALAWGPTIGGYGLYTASLNYLPASVANLIASLEPAMTAGLAYLLLGEQMTAVQLFGSALIVSGVILLRVEGLRNRRTAKVLR